jgi:hypothetical protein
MAYGFVTVTFSVAVPRLPCVSVAEHVTVVVPIGNVLPDAGLQETGRSPSALSVANVLNSTTAPFSELAAAVTSPEVVMTGGAMSSGLDDSLTSVQP